MTERNAADIGLSGGVDPDTVERNVLADELESRPHSKLVLHDSPIGPSIEEKTTLNRGRNWQSGFFEGFAVGARDRKVGHKVRKRIRGRSPLARVSAEASLFVRVPGVTR